MSNKDRLDDEGVYSVGRIFHRELEWIFREQSKADYGIDALVEICNGTVPTGQLVAVQIKSGESYFKESNNNGYVFRFSDRHQEYWINHCLPVIVALYNPDTELVLWEKIQPNNIKSTGKGWKLTIPYKNLLGTKSGIKISSLATINKSGYEDVDQYAYFQNNDIIASEKVITPLMNCMRNAQKELLVCAPYIDVDFLSILNVVSYSAKVKLITQTNLKEHIESTIRYYSSKNDNLRIKRSSSVHSRFVVIDKKFAFMTSMNFTQENFHRRVSNHELILPTNEESMVTKYSNLFSELWKN
ncbi:hypothetical protein XM69_c11768, partial [Vibrio parahaemolyticus]|uniref:DUF4365 domain-containing protein n=1 Tax=Vibrio parahaemolyticus TaxID=670 RepID=UPI0009C9BA05